MSNERTPRVESETTRGGEACSSAGGLLERGTRSRALCKALGYRVLMLVTTVVIALAVTGDPGVAIDIGLAATVVKTATYYGYERVWNAV
ncbi:DUF2061 domain-containing protein [Halopiger goleimassiliensis]|uniref:DUF2061 domain-containing protein n=1 Tax=Halopiger goleimassiliensis TaxID=1293048 RepID=UPI000677A16B|nr:DUF2061 domain-containing protein [Halopiger goleimassiliensis]